MTTVSIIITNYNYARFLRPCIDSALAQTHPDVEVIVVDDGSTDDSTSVIRSYGSGVGAILQPNGGQASAFNNGYRRSTGDVVIFLDADDLLEPTAAAGAVAMLAEAGVIKAHWPLIEIDGESRETGRLVPASGRDLPVGDLRAEVLARGPATKRYPPTTGHAWARPFLDRVLPMDEDTFRIGADTLLFELAPFVGSMARSTKPLGRYRVHGTNHWHKLPFADQLDHELRFYARSVEVAQRLAALDRCPVGSIEDWGRHGWWPRLARAIATIETVLDEGEDFALIDDGAWGLARLDDRRVDPFPRSAGGDWAGVPENDQAAAAALDAVRPGTGHLVVGWSTRWWLDAYPSLTERLGRPVIRTADVDIYRLGTG